MCNCLFLHGPFRLRKINRDTSQTYELSKLQIKEVTLMKAPLRPIVVTDGHALVFVCS
jgi:hypothetical protein